MQGLGALQPPCIAHTFQASLGVFCIRHTCSPTPRERASPTPAGRACSACQTPAALAAPARPCWSTCSACQTLHRDPAPLPPAMAASVSLAHVGAGCNRVCNALHWGEEGLLAFAAHNAVLVYHPEEARVLGTLLGHTDRVACVLWLPPAALGLPGARASQPTAALASGAGDDSVRIWQWSPGTPGQPWRLAAVLQGHASPVTSLAALPLPDKQPGLLLVSTAGDSEVLVWECSIDSAEAERSAGSSGIGSSLSNGGASTGGTQLPDAPPLLQQGAWRLRQRLPVGHVLQDCAALAPLPADPSWVLLALGGVDGLVRLFLCPPGPEGRFQPVCSLAGHQDWVKGLAFAQLDDGRLLLASASQDKNVRVWAVRQLSPSPDAGISSTANGSAANGAAAASQLPGSASLLTRYAPKPLINAGQRQYSATLEALLVGHEDWVHSVAWHPRVELPGGGTSQPACLLSASMDRTMMVWRPDDATGLWMSEESVGDAGANHLGYYTGVWSPDGSAICAHGFTGALHLWRRPGSGSEAEGGGVDADGGWLPVHALGGHFGPVVDACWAADGACLLSVSCDQTARLTTRLAGGHWCEVARPQVHGHDFSCVAALPAGACGSSGGSSGGGGSSRGDDSTEGNSSGRQPRFLYASGSEEKVIRVFEAPRAFRDTLDMARGRAPAAGAGARQGQGGRGGAAAALGALLPALGLSNKAIFEEEEEEEGGGEEAQGGSGAAAESGLLATGAEAYGGGADFVPQSAPSAVAGPPLEEHLAQNTLWPEVHKLYGHGNELFCLAADPLGRYLASACRAQSADAAAIWLWDTAKWTGAAQLHAHTLTVTQLSFSPDGRFLASASRDRTVAVFERQPEQQTGSGSNGSSSSGAAAGDGGAAAGEQAPFRLLGRIKAHSRIVWGLHWSPDSRLLATASRDGKVKVWSVAGEPAAPAALPAAPAATVDCGDSVRSVQFSPDCGPAGGSYHLAAGLEGGSVQLLRLSPSEASDRQHLQLQHELVWQASLFEQHAAAVRRLCWRREEGEGAGEAAQAGSGSGSRRYLQLASCSDDHSVRIFSVAL